MQPFTLTKHLPARLYRRYGQIDSASYFIPYLQRDNFCVYKALVYSHVPSAPQTCAVEAVMNALLPLCFIFQ